VTVIESLPGRPLSDGDVAALHRSEGIEMAVPVGEVEGETAEGPTTGLLLVTDAWVSGLAFGDDGWTAVERVSLDGTERFDALRAAEEAVLVFQGRD
jgi:hypothetical protein